jgi:hypothetical protein
MIYMSYILHMTWMILFHDEFEAWFDQQDPSLQEEIAAVLDVLEERGPTLGRPYVDTIKESSFNNMKELRVQFRGCPWRILFAFDPERKAILLVGGNKQGNKRWYEENIPIADQRFKDHLEQLQQRKQQ